MEPASELLKSFENCTRPQLSHLDHVKITWLTLQHESVYRAIQTLRAGFQKYAASKNMPGLFHETITVSFVLLIHQKMNQQQGVADWSKFIDANPELRIGVSLLHRWYHKSTLESDEARRIFVMPDRITPQ